ncbi:MAG: AmmeMemoRadiSam system protein B [Candidatus Sericytochromatia bacterium]
MLLKKAAVADFFYTANPEVLKNQVNECIEKSVNITLNGDLKGLIVPHAGYIYSGIVAGSAYKQLKKHDNGKNKKVIILGPSHRYPLRTVSVCAYDEFETPLGNIKGSSLAKEMAKELGFIPDADKFEHSLEVQLPFLKMSLKNFEIIPIVVGHPDIKELSEFLKNYIDENTYLLISTDLSHFFPYEKAVMTDTETSTAIINQDINKMAHIGDACGIVGVLTSMFMAHDLSWKTEFLDYKNSGDTAGTKDKVVGYGAYAYIN